MKKRHVIVFDFDGVILPSEGIKIRGYSKIFSDFGEEVPHEAIKKARYEFADAKGNRFDIIRGIFNRIGTSDIEHKVAEYGARYGKIVKEEVEALQVSEKVRTLLRALSKENCLYINSNNPDESLRITIKSLGIAEYFQGIFGSSRTKEGNLREIARLESVDPKHVLFIGDGGGDLRAAEEFGCEFIGIATAENGWGNIQKSFEVLPSLEQLTIATRESLV